MVDSKKPRKQRKARYNASLHKVKDYMHCHLSKELKEKLNTKKRSLLVKKGDSIKICVGKYKGKNVKISKVSYIKRKIYLEGLTVRNAKGDEVKIPFEPSNLILIDLVDKEKRGI